MDDKSVKNINTKEIANHKTRHTYFYAWFYGYLITIMLFVIYGIGLLLYEGLTNQNTNAISYFEIQSIFSLFVTVLFAPLAMLVNVFFNPWYLVILIIYLVIFYKIHQNITLSPKIRMFLLILLAILLNILGLTSLGNIIYQLAV